MACVEIDGKEIGPGYPPYVVAEISGNHNGKLDRALELIEMAKECGADAVKIQTYTPDTMTLKSSKDDFKIKGGLWDGHTLYDLYKWAHTPWDWHQKLFDRAKEVGITIFSSPFDESAVDFLDELGAPAYKVASFEMTDLPLVRYIANKKKPMVMSTGMANLDEIRESVATIYEEDWRELILLHCVSGYPTPVEQINSRVVARLQDVFPEVVVGLSDHTLSSVADIVAVAQGACFIEKHFIDSRDSKGPDSAFSIEPAELKQLTADVKTAWLALGTGEFDLKPAEKKNLTFRRSIYFVKDLKAGQVVAKGDIRRIRPGFGLPPKEFSEVMGKRVLRDIEAGSPVKWQDLEI